jgi:pimeloyl-ACP methyl ester carboxylesterase
MPAPQIHEYRLHVGGLECLLAQVGSGRDILFLPSMLVRTRSYRRTIVALARRGFRVTSVEMPGSGGGSRLFKTWDFHDYGIWIGKLLQQMDLDRPILIGHSDSAGAALCGAVVAPDRISALVLCASVGFDPRFSFWRIAVGRGIDIPLEPDFSMIAAVDVAYNACRHFRNFFHQIWICTKSDLRRYASQVQVPTLLAWGAHDHAIPFRCAQLAAEHIRDSEIYVSASGCHDWLGDRPNEFASAVSHFVSRVESQRYDPGSNVNSTNTARRTGARLIPS